MTSTLICDFSEFPCITVPIRASFKPKIIKSSKKTRKIKKIIKATPGTQMQPYESDFEVIKPRGSVKTAQRFSLEDSCHLKKKIGVDTETIPKKLKELSNSLQIMSVFLILMKIYAIMVKRISIVNRAFSSRDFRTIWRQSALIVTELVKYIKDLTMKTKMIKSHDAKNLALLTESFYKSIKIYENVMKKNKSFIGLLWKLLKFFGTLLKILINFDYIFPLEVLLPSSYLFFLAFGFKAFGQLRKAFRLIKSAIKRWNMPKRRFILLMKLVIVLFKMVTLVLALINQKYLVFYIVSGQISLHFVIFCCSIKEIFSYWLLNRKKQVTKPVEIKLIIEKKPRISFESEKEGEKENNEKKTMSLSRRILETRIGKEEISI